MHTAYLVARSVQWAARLGAGDALFPRLALLLCFALLACQAQGVSEDSAEQADTDTGTDVCDQLTSDPSDVGATCETGADCEVGYTCQLFNGFVASMTCQILCTESCQCPDGHSCVVVEDKLGSWMECHP